MTIKTVSQETQNNESKIWKSICEVFNRIWNMEYNRICNWDRMVMHQVWTYVLAMAAVGTIIMIISESEFFN